MTISVDPATSVISIPKADLTLITGTLFEHDTEAFRLELIDFEDSELGIVQPRTHTHNTQVTIVGVTYARFIEMLSPYSVEYEDGAYSVRLAGSNNNLFDVENGILVQNTVQLIAQNSAGLIVVVSGSGLSVAQDDKLDEIWAERNLDPARPVARDEKGNVDFGAVDIDADTTGVTPDRVTTQTRQP